MRWLPLVAAGVHPSWEVDHATGTLCRYRRSKGPRTVLGLQRWFLKTYPEQADELWHHANTEVLQARRGEHPRIVK